MGVSVGRPSARSCPLDGTFLEWTGPWSRLRARGISLQERESSRLADACSAQNVANVLLDQRSVAKLLSDQQETLSGAREKQKGRDKPCVWHVGERVPEEGEVGDDDEDDAQDRVTEYEGSDEHKNDLDPRKGVSSLLRL